MEVVVLASGLGFTEGPVLRRSGAIVVTAVPDGRVYSIAGGTTEVLAVTGGGPNGAAEGADGSLFIAQNGGRRIGSPDASLAGGIQVVRPAGEVGWLTADLVAPNDLCFGPDGLLYVTDPTRRPARDDGRLWRVDVESGESELLASVRWYPNGIAFGIEDDALYVASTGERSIRRFPFGSGGLGRSETVIRMEHGQPDGLAFDAGGHLLVAAFGSERSGRDGPSGEVQVWSTDGRLLDVVRPSDDPSCSNVALSEHAELVVTGAHSGDVLLVSPWPSAGLPLHPFRRPPQE